jgi:probable rRNA maturation factor
VQRIIRAYEGKTQQQELPLEMGDAGDCRQTWFETAVNLDLPYHRRYPGQSERLLRSTMILFDPDQPEAANGFPQLGRSSMTVSADASLRAVLPSRPTLKRYLREAQTAVALKGEVSVLLTTDEGIRGLNRRFRKKNKATDVLSFPAPDFGFGSAGDLAISVETAARQAEEQGHRLSVELRVLMLHGLLHLAGYDHEADAGDGAERTAFAG